MAVDQTSEIAQYEMEQSGLQMAISSAEAVLAASAPDIRGVLERFLQGARGAGSGTGGENQKYVRKYKSGINEIVAGDFPVRQCSWRKAASGSVVTYWMLE